MEGGVSRFVLKDAPVDALARAIRRCADGEEVIDPMLAARALRAASCPLSSYENRYGVSRSEARSTNTYKTGSSHETA